LVIGFACALSKSLLYEALNPFWDDCYYHLNEAAFIFYLLCIFLTAFKGTPKWSTGWITFAGVVVLASLTTIGDEIAGTATDVGLHDLYRFGSVLLIVAVMRYKLIAGCKRLLKRLGGS